MIRFFSTLFLFATIMSCSQNPSSMEKERIKNLEEKTRALEKELSEVKSKIEEINIVQEEKGTSKSNSDYFTIGSTEDEVIDVMGEPTSYIKTADEARKFHYGISTVYFYRGKVISYDNLENNLKVKVKR